MFAFWTVDFAPRSSDPRDRAAVDELYDALSRVPADLRIPWVLHRVEHLSLPETAAACEVSLATVKRRIADAEERIERRLGPTDARSDATTGARHEPPPRSMIDLGRARARRQHGTSIARSACARARFAVVTCACVAIARCAVASSWRAARASWCSRSCAQRRAHRPSRRPRRPRPRGGRRAEHGIPSAGAARRSARCARRLARTTPGSRRD